MANNIGIILDMDGVIVDSNPAHKKAIQLFCKKYNQDLSDSFLHDRLYGRTNKEWIPELFGKLSPERLKELADEKEQIFRDLFNPEEHVVEGLYEFLEETNRQNIPVAVATSAPVENAHYILNRLNIYNYFEAVLDSSHVTRGKPHPEVYIKASKALGKSPGDCTVFEDSVSGVKAGLAAGASVVGVLTTHSAGELASCHKVIKNFNEVSLNELLATV